MKDYFKKPKPVIGSKQATGKDIATAIMKNGFLKATTKGDTFTENGALSNSSTGDILVDDFAKAGSYRGRETDLVFTDAGKLWDYNPELALKEFFYLRLITRKPKGFNIPITTVQRGQGNKDESLRRLLWVAYFHSEIFYKNLWLIPLVGSFKDLWTLMGIDTQNKLDHSKFFEIMRTALHEDEDLKDLVLKYMPSIKASSKLKTDRSKVLNELGKEFAVYLRLTHKEYRILKSSGKAHIWQQKITKGYYDQIDFNAIPGKALFLLVKGKFLANHQLEEKYEAWIESQPVAKFNGYPYELMTSVNKFNISSMKTYKIKTINKQFDNLIKTAKDNNGAITGNVWCALDTSGSMGIGVTDKVSAYDVCISLGIYFSELNTGAFHNHVIMFDNVSKVKQLSGTFTDKVNDIVHTSTAWGSTNFQSVIDEIVRIRRKFPEIPIEDYPETLLVVSDMQFNVSGHWGSKSTYSQIETNYQAAMRKLNAVGLPDIKIVWWQVTGRTSDFPSTINDKGTYFFSGFDGAVISLLLGGNQKEKPSMMQLLNDTLNQEILAQIKL